MRNFTDAISEADLYELRDGDREPETTEPGTEEDESEAETEKAASL